MKNIVSKMQIVLKTGSIAVCLLFVTGLTPALAGAAAPPPQTPTPCPTGTDVKGSSKTQVLGGLGETTTNCSAGKAQSMIGVVTTILSWVVGIIAIIMVLVSGAKYILSGGDSNKVAEAKRTLIYSLVGLFFAAVAQVLVHFVINQTKG